MLLTQGWKKQKDGTLVVSAIAISACTNGIAGWQVHVGCYDPNRGESIQNATWEFKCAMHNFHGLLTYPVIDEMLTWVDVQQGQDLKTTLGRIEGLLADIAKRLPVG